jgi:hypothetical protein
MTTLPAGWLSIWMSKKTRGFEGDEAY